MDFSLLLGIIVISTVSAFLVCSIIYTIKYLTSDKSKKKNKYIIITAILITVIAIFNYDNLYKISSPGKYNIKELNDKSKELNYIIILPNNLATPTYDFVFKDFKNDAEVSEALKTYEDSLNKWEFVNTAVYKLILDSANESYEFVSEIYKNIKKDDFDSYNEALNSYIEEIEKNIIHFNKLLKLNNIEKNNISTEIEKASSIIYAMTGKSSAEINEILEKALILDISRREKGLESIIERLSYVKDNLSNLYL